MTENEGVKPGGRDPELPMSREEYKARRLRTRAKVDQEALLKARAARHEANRAEFEDNLRMTIEQIADSSLGKSPQERVLENDISPLRPSPITPEKQLELEEHNDNYPWGGP